MNLTARLADLFNPRPELDIEKLGISPLAFILRGFRVVVTPKDSLLTARLGNGTIIRGRNRPGYGGRGVFMFRDAVEPELQLMAKILETGDVAIDVGSCVGTYTMTAAAQVGDSGAVIAVDPDPDAISVLRGTAEQNGFTNIAAICCAASNTVGFTQFTVEEERPDTRHMDGGVMHATDTMHRVVSTRTIDSITEGLGLDERVRFIKIDAEGAEAMVLAGARQTIERSRPVIVLETEISDVPSIAGYEVFASIGSRNHVLVHSQDAAAYAKVADHLGLPSTEASQSAAI